MARKDNSNSSNHSVAQQQETVNRAEGTAHALTGEEYFAIGTQLKLVKCNDQTVEGEVLAFDPMKKILCLKRPSSSKKPGLNDFLIVNFDMVKSFDILSEPTEAKSPIRPCETAASEARLRANLAKRKKFARAFKQGISEDGINVFRAISKTLEEIDWKDKSIVVMGKVTISPPYKADNVKGNAETAVQHVRKIVEKFHEEQRVIAEKASSESTVTNSNAHGQNAAAVAQPQSQQSSSPSPMNSTPTPPSSNSSQAGTPTTAQPAVPAQSSANSNPAQPRKNEDRRGNKGKNFKSGSGGGGGPQTPKPIFPWAHFKPKLIEKK